MSDDVPLHALLELQGDRPLARIGSDRGHDGVEALGPDWQSHRLLAGLDAHPAVVRRGVEDDPAGGDELVSDVHESSLGRVSILDNLTDVDAPLLLLLEHEAERSQNVDGVPRASRRGLVLGLLLGGGPDHGTTPDGTTRSHGRSERDGNGSGGQCGTHLARRSGVAKIIGENSTCR